MKDTLLIQVNCCRCGSWDTETIVKTPDYELHIETEFEVAKCRNCDHIYTSIRPNYNTLFTKFYPDDYICYGSRSGNKIADFIDRKRIEGQASQRSNMIKEYFPQKEPIKLLEIGCATGEFIKVCHQRFGWEAEGVEPNEQLSRILRTEGFHIICSTLEEADLPAEQYDVVCLFNVLEHLWDPTFSLKLINKSLKPGGIIVVEIPDFGSLARGIFGKYWFLYHLPRHLAHFTHSSLGGMMEECGFERIKIIKQFRPTVNVLSFQYAVHDKIKSNFVRSFCSAKNPLMIAVGISFEVLQNLIGNSNIITAIFQKRSAIPEPILPFLQERDQ